MKSHIWLFFILASSLNCYSLDMNTALSSAYETNDILKSQREKTKANDEQIMQSFSRWLPSVTLGAQKRELRAETAGVSSKTKGTTKSLTVSQNIFRGGADIAAMKIAKASIEQSRAELVSKEQEILVSVVETYLKTLQIEEEHKIAEEQLVDAKLLLQSAERRFQAGDATKTDVAQANASLAESLSSMIHASGNFEILKAKFREITGMDPHKLILPSANVILPKTLETTIKLALRNSPELISSRSNDKAARNRVTQVRGENLMPSVQLQYQIQDNRDDKRMSAGGFTQDALNKQALVSLNITLFDGGASWSKYRQAKRTYQQSKYSLASARQNVITFTTQVWREFESKKSIYKARKEEVNSSRTAYEGTKKEEKAGIRSIGDVIIARSNYYNAYRKMLNARTEYISARYKIASSIGECTAKHLGLDVKLYDPMKNYNSIRMQLVGSYNPD